MSTTVLLGTLDAASFANTYEMLHRFFFLLAFCFHLIVGLALGLGAGLVAMVFSVAVSRKHRADYSFAALFFGVAIGSAMTLQHGGVDSSNPFWRVVHLFPPALIWLVFPGLFAIAGHWLARMRPLQGLPFVRLCQAAVVPVLVCGVVSAVMMGRGDTRMAVEFPPEPAEDLPNVAILVIDNLRADHLGCYGYGLDITPHIDALSQQGVRFKQAISTSNYTPPPHATLLTGNYPSRNGVVDTHRALPEANVTIAEILSDRGYATIGVISNLQVAGIFGYDQGFDVYDDSVVDMRAPIVWLTQTPGFAFLRDIGVSQFSLRALVIDRLGWISSISAARTNDRIFQYLDQVRGRPWFLFVNYIDPHFPWSPPMEYEGRVEIPGEDLRTRDEEIAMNQLFADVLQDREHRMSGDFDSDDMAYYLARYDREIEYLDVEIQRLVERLAATGELDRTILVVTSDHGEHFGEHELLYHHNSFYEELVDVPLIMRYPEALPAATVVDRVVSLVDVPATVLDLAGIPAAQPMHGASLLPYVQTGNDAMTGSTDGDDLLAGGFAISEWKAGRRLLATHGYRAEFVADSLVAIWEAGLEPDQRRDLASDDPELAENVTRIMREWIDTQVTGVIQSRDVEIDRDAEARLRALGYVD